MAAGDGDALVCDFAQTYHILDWRALPLSLAATLAAGLPAGSRSMRRLMGLKAPLETVLLAAISDKLTTWLWWHTEDGRAGRRPPERTAARLVGGAGREADRDGAARVFASKEDWLAAYEAAINGGETQ